VIKPPQTPDLTRVIMGRLGYMRVPSAVARRQRVRRMVMRGVTLGVIVAVAATGVALYGLSPDARRPLGDSAIPAALRIDLHQHQQRVSSVLEIFKPATPISAPATAAEPAGEWLRDEPFLEEPDEEVIRSAVAPFRWA
jgi:hypothetical protein